MKRITLEPRRKLRHNLFALVCLAQIAVGSASVAAADGNEQMAVVTGKIVDTSGKPVAAAFVAAYDSKMNVVSSSHTDQHGNYSLGVPRSSLHVDRKGKTFFTQVNTNFNRAVSVASTIIPVAHMVSEGAKQIKGTRSGGPQSPPPIVIDSSLAAISKGKPVKVADAQKAPGALMIKAVAADYADLTAVAQAYWIQQESAATATGSAPTVVGWMDSLVLAHASTGKLSGINTVPVEIHVARVTPSLVKQGDKTKITAQFTYPDSPKIYSVVIARDATTGNIWELKPSAPGKYSADIAIDDSFRATDHILSVIAYAADSDHSGRRADLEEEIGKSGLWDPRRNYIFNPLLVVSRNRYDVTLTVAPR